MAEFRRGHTAMAPFSTQPPQEPALQQLGVARIAFGSWSAMPDGRCGPLAPDRSVRAGRRSGPFAGVVGVSPKQRSEIMRIADPISSPELLRPLLEYEPLVGGRWWWNMIIWPRCSIGLKQRAICDQLDSLVDEAARRELTVRVWLSIEPGSRKIPRYRFDHIQKLTCGGGARSALTGRQIGEECSSNLR
jgi:hypothetical protein